jgi:hypothetical protein
VDSHCRYPAIQCLHWGGFGYGVLGWDCVATHINDDNVAAQRLVEALGEAVLTRGPSLTGWNARYISCRAARTCGLS